MKGFGEWGRFAYDLRNLEMYERNYQSSTALVFAFTSFKESGI